MKSKSVRIVAIESNVNHCDKIYKGLIAKGVGCSITKIEKFTTTFCTSPRVKNIKKVLKKRNDEITVFIPDMTEIYLPEPDFSIMFSGYKSWCASNRTIVIPHTETPNAGFTDLEAIKWSKKPELVVGFMGNSYKSSRAASLAASLPAIFKKQIIEARHLKHVESLLWHKRTMPSIFYLPCLARIDSLRKLEATSLKQDIVDTQAFNPSSKVIRQFQNHLLRNTYILCPRGTENFSFRFYEALNHGRIPVLIDTNMMLPSKVDWDELCVRVPYENLGELEMIVRNDYETKTEREFIKRQEKGLSTMAELKKENWLNDIIAQIARLAEGSQLATASYSS